MSDETDTISAPQPSGEFERVDIVDEMKTSYLDYAMSVIIGRALPDVRDGLKPVHRRVLYAMHELNNDWNKPYKKSARIVGDVVGKYHPHGDTAVYDTLVRMAQSFSLRYELVDGQGNFGSIDGDSPAAMRYTEVRMSKLAHAMLEDIDKETVNFLPNYDETEFVPEVLPARVPNLLINGSSGIAVGMATNIPPHNLAEVIDATMALIDAPELSIDDIMQMVPGPDFPTQGIINGRGGIVQAYRTGRGRIYVRARAEIETKANGREAIIVNEFPYQVNKAHTIERIAALVKEGKLEGISALRDESDKDGIRVVIEIKRGEVAEVVLNNLYSQTQLQTVFGINMVALVDGQPKLLNIKQMLQAFIRHRREVVTRRVIFELRKAKEKAHLLEGLSVALANIDEVIALIKQAQSPAIAKEALLAKLWQAAPVEAMLERAGVDKLLDSEEGFGLTEQGYRLTAAQAQAILDLRLHKLTGLEQDKITDEFQGLLSKIKELQDILDDVSKLLDVIKSELKEMREAFGDERRTEIISSQHDLTMEDLIADEKVVITLSHQGYTKRQPLDTYRAQRRGGRGRKATNIKQEDIVDKLLIANTHDTILCFSNFGKVYWLKVYHFPEASPTTRGKPIVNLLPLSEGEKINTILPLRDFHEEHYVFMATAKGTVKKVSLKEFSRPRQSGIIALDIVEGDYLVGAKITDGQHDLLLFSNAGKAIRFNESDVRAMGRTARGVRGIKLKEGQRVVSLMVVKDHGTVLTATENGYGKRTAIEEYRPTGRGGQGVISIQVSERNGDVVGALEVEENDHVMLITSRGKLVRTDVKGISIIGRNTQGVRLINLSEGEKLVSIGRIMEDIDEEGDDASSDD
ncbi:MAG: DNA gyrase subunit A [Gammaproteobacteria bacterium]